MPYCAKCGNPYDEGDKFCEKCGNPLTEEPIEEKPKENGVTEQPKIIEKKVIAEKKVEPVVVEKKGGGGGKWLFILIILGVIGGVVIYGGKEVAQREAMANVDVSVQSVGLEDIGFTSATLKVTLNMYNPNKNIAATLDSADFVVYANNQRLGSGVHTTRINIPAMGSRNTNIYFRIGYMDAGKAVVSAIKQGQVNWRVEGVAHISTPLGTLNIPFSG